MRAFFLRFNFMKIFSKFNKPDPARLLAQYEVLKSMIDSIFIDDDFEYGDIRSM